MTVFSLSFSTLFFQWVLGRSGGEKSGWESGLLNLTIAGHRGHKRCFRGTNNNKKIIPV